MVLRVIRYLFGTELQVRCTKCRGAYWSMNEYKYVWSPLIIDSCARCTTPTLGTRVIDTFAKRRYTR